MDDDGNILCHLCDSTFFTTSKLAKHYKVVHPKAKLFECEECNLLFTKKATLIKHIKGNHEVPLLKMRSKDSRKHFLLENYKDIAISQSEKCAEEKLNLKTRNIKYNNVSKEQNRRRIDSPSKFNKDQNFFRKSVVLDNECSVCQKYFSHRSSLKRHLRTVHSFNMNFIRSIFIPQNACRNMLTYHEVKTNDNYVIEDHHPLEWNKSDSTCENEPVDIKRNSKIQKINGMKYEAIMVKFSCQEKYRKIEESKGRSKRIFQELLKGDDAEEGMILDDKKCEPLGVEIGLQPFQVNDSLTNYNKDGSDIRLQPIAAGSFKNSSSAKNSSLYCKIESNAEASPFNKNSLALQLKCKNTDWSHRQVSTVDAQNAQDDKGSQKPGVEVVDLKKESTQKRYIEDTMELVEMGDALNDEENCEEPKTKKLKIDNDFVNGVFRCMECHAIFYQRKEYVFHMEWTHMEVRPYRCSKCSSCFRNAKSLQVHDASVHDKLKPHLCPECGACFGQRASLYRHIKEVAHMLIHCSYCSASFTVKRELTLHISKFHSTLKPYKCQHCDRAFVNGHQLTIHISTVHEKRRPYICKCCGAAFGQRSSLYRHVKTINHKGISIKCPFCSGLFKKKADLKIHIANEHNSNHFICILCRRHFLNEKLYTNHMKSMHNEMPVLSTLPNCSQSDLSASSKKKRKISENKFQCCDCKSVFNKKLYLKRHLENALQNADLLKCKVCSMKFCHQKHLKSHFKEGTCTKQVKVKKADDLTSKSVHERVRPASILHPINTLEPKSSQSINHSTFGLEQPEEAVFSLPGFKRSSVVWPSNKEPLNDRKTADPMNDVVGTKSQDAVATLSGTVSLPFMSANNSTQFVDTKLGNANETIYNINVRSPKSANDVTAEISESFDFFRTGNKHLQLLFCNDTNMNSSLADSNTETELHDLATQIPSSTNSAIKDCTNNSYEISSSESYNSVLDCDNLVDTPSFQRTNRICVPIKYDAQGCEIIQREECTRSLHKAISSSVNPIASSVYLTSFENDLQSVKYPQMGVGSSFGYYTYSYPWQRLRESSSNVTAETQTSMDASCVIYGDALSMPKIIDNYISSEYSENSQPLTCNDTFQSSLLSLPEFNHSEARVLSQDIKTYDPSEIMINSIYSHNEQSSVPYLPRIVSLEKEGTSRQNYDNYRVTYLLKVLEDNVSNWNTKNGVDEHIPIENCALAMDDIGGVSDGYNNHDFPKSEFALLLDDEGEELGRPAETDIHTENRTYALTLHLMESLEKQFGIRSSDNLKHPNEHVSILQLNRSSNKLDIFQNPKFILSKSQGDLSF